MEYNVEGKVSYLLVVNEECDNHCSQASLLNAVYFVTLLYIDNFISSADANSDTLDPVTTTNGLLYHNGLINKIHV